MPKKQNGGAGAWVDPDDAPELTKAWFAGAEITMGDKLISNASGRLKADTTKQLISLRLDADVVERFRATGDGWQTRINAALRDWLDRSA